VRRELKGNKSDKKHDGSRSLDLLLEPTTVIAAAYIPLF
jgi:hypothetical protein